jgi:hypothetical protein
MLASPAVAQMGGGGIPGGGGGGTFVTGAVGGISIDVNGALAEPLRDNVQKLRAMRNAAIDQQGAEVNRSTPLRKISLRRLDAAIAAHLADGSPLSDDILNMAGMQRIQYVFVYPEANDVVLAGPAEGWKIGPGGDVVGKTSHLPTLQLDDLLIALRTAETTARTGVSCSIDPSNEGVERLRKFLATQRTIGSNPGRTVEAMKQAMGPQSIRVEGVPDTSHFARVLVAADYRMKRLAMDLQEAPVAGMPSYLDMLQSSRGRAANMMPRWWLTPKYEPLRTDGEGLAWELRKPTVTTMTEEDFVNADGSREQSGTTSPLAQKWADSMTDRYDALSVEMPIFAQLRNCMDLAVLGALISKERLLQRAGMNPRTLNDPAQLAAMQLPAPRQIDSQASLIKKGRNYMISVSGGVQMNPWAIVEKVEREASLGSVHAGEAASVAEASNWWWN